MDDQKAERPRNPNGTFQVGQPRPEIPRRAKGVPTNKLTTLDIQKGILARIWLSTRAAVERYLNGGRWQSWSRNMALTVLTVQWIDE